LNASHRESTFGEQAARTVVPFAIELPGTMFLKRLLYYLNPASLFAKTSENGSLRFMHGINRISILLFLAGVVVMVVRAMNR
jgi:hypothetical protein